MLSSIAQTGASPVAYSTGMHCTAVGGKNASTHSSGESPPAAEKAMM